MVKKVLIALAGGLVVMVLGFLIYLSTGQYQAKLFQEYQLVEENGTLIKLHDSDIGFIFYQGGKVENEAYSYLSLVEANVFLLDTPFNLSIFSINQAQTIIDKYPNIKTWYIGGHSLGGSTAYLFANQTSTPIAGIIYLGAYPTAVNSFRQLAIFGSRDGLLDYQDYLSYFDEADTVKVIEGGNHANFGEYGPQAGDNYSTIGSLCQKTLTLEYINEFIGGNK